MDLLGYKNDIKINRKWIFKLNVMYLEWICCLMELLFRIMEVGWLFKYICKFGIYS